jgi:hypothetical protein
MKTTKLSAHRFLIALATVAALALSTGAKADNVAQVAKVVQITGSARVMEQGNWRSIKLGDFYEPGSTIQTGEKSSLDVIFVDRASLTRSAAKIRGPIPPSVLADPPARTHGTEQLTVSTVHIFQNTTLSVDKLLMDRSGQEEVSNTELELKDGFVFGNTKKLSVASKYNVKIPTGVAGIRGTVYYIGSNGTVAVLSGAVIVAVLNSATGVITPQVVTAGEYYNPTTQTVQPIPSTGVGGVGDGTVAPLDFAIDLLQALADLFDEDIALALGDGDLFATPGGIPIIVFISPVVSPH